MKTNIKHHLIDNENLTVDKNNVKGKGSFGKVYVGTYYECPVAIKTFKKDTDIDQLEKEAKILL